MTMTRKFTGASIRNSCADCMLRYRGLCRSVDDRDAEAVAALESSHSPVRVYDAGAVIYGQGEAGDHVFNLISGWVALHRDISDGRRQITRLLLPGAMFGAKPRTQERGHTATAVTNVTVCPMPGPSLDDLRRRVPALNEQFILMLERDNHRAFEWMTTLGQGSAKERIATLLGDLAVAVAGEAALDAGVIVKVPLTQRLIADATGLTSVHVNRLLRKLREELIIEFHNGILTITDPWKLRALTERAGDPLRHAAGARIGAGPPAYVAARIAQARGSAPALADQPGG
jgi:CRP-like cAMP-binding protein